VDPVHGDAPDPPRNPDPPRYIRRRAYHGPLAPAQYAGHQWPRPGWTLSALRFAPTGDLRAAAAMRGARWASPAGFVLDDVPARYFQAMPSTGSVSSGSPRNANEPVEG
jgi:hypothetical protein